MSTKMLLCESSEWHAENSNLLSSITPGTTAQLPVILGKKIVWDVDEVVFGESSEWHAENSKFAMDLRTRISWVRAMSGEPSPVSFPFYYCVSFFFLRTTVSAVPLLKVCSWYDLENSMHFDDL